ncbi:hypothetical protein [Georgenia sp. SUBG003]|uniref:hypothetical protein n=1 Tax=Georgenia sp. SUBG003 TaxID=1497974 RepID=UPI003AB4B357
MTTGDPAQEEGDHADDERGDRQAARGALPAGKRRRTVRLPVRLARRLAVGSLAVVGRLAVGSLAVVGRLALGRLAVGRLVLVRAGLGGVRVLLLAVGRDVGRLASSRGRGHGR